MRRISEKRLLWFSGLAVVLLTGWLYWRTLRLPLIYDTLLHIRIAGGLNFASVWLPTEAFGFYRPMTFFPMLLIQRLFNGYPAWLLHANNVVQHAANAGLLAWLSWRLWPDWRRALASGAIFAVFPFSYQAVAVYGHNVHPAIVGLGLLGLHSYLTAVSPPKSKGTPRYAEGSEKESLQSVKLGDKKRRHWQILTWLLFGLMLLTHETAVLFGGFALLVQINAQPDLLKKWRALLRQPWRWFLLAGVVYLVIYQFLPISRAPQAAASGRDLWLNGLYLLQAAVFPLTWFAHVLPQMSGAWVALVSGGFVVSLSGWLAWRRPDWRTPLLLAWGWWAGASLLLWVTLPTDYLLRGPRLLYLGSVGVALLWAHLLAAVWDGRSPIPSLAKIRGFVWTAVLAFILITSGQFVQTKLTQYEQLTEPVRVWQDNPNSFPNAEVVFVNLPQWLDVPPKTYAIGVEFVAMLGDYLFVEELSSANLPGAHKTWAVNLPELQSSQPYAYGVQAQNAWPTAISDQPRHFFITYFLPEGPQTQHTGFVWPKMAQSIAPRNVPAQFGFYTLAAASAETCNNTIEVSLRWLPGSEAIPDTTSIFVQVLDENGRLLTQADGPPLGIRPGLLAASPDDLLVDLRTLELAEAETAVPTTVLVGVYDFASGVRSPATDAAGQPLPDNAWRIPISACP